MATIKLTDGQRIRIPESRWIFRITFHVNVYDKNYYTRISPDYDIEHFNEICNTKFGIFAYSCSPGCSITGDYDGKKESIERDKSEFAAAPVIEEGDIIEVDGIDHTFIAHIVGEQYSDPIHFEIQ